jgi:hypothetical protein
MMPQFQLQELEINLQVCLIGRIEARTANPAVWTLPGRPSKAFDNSYCNATWRGRKYQGVRHNMIVGPYILCRGG